MFIIILVFVFCFGVGIVCGYVQRPPNQISNSMWLEWNVETVPGGWIHVGQVHDGVARIGVVSSYVPNPAIWGKILDMKENE